MKINKDTDKAIFEALFGVVEAIFNEFSNFCKISWYLHGHNYIGLILTSKKHVICKYFIYLISIAIT